MNIQKVNTQPNFNGLLRVSSLNKIGKEIVFSENIVTTKNFQDGIAKSLAEKGQIDVLTNYLEKILGQSLSLDSKKLQFYSGENAIILMDRADNIGSIVKLDFNS